MPYRDGDTHGLHPVAEDHQHQQQHHQQQQQPQQQQQQPQQQQQQQRQQQAASAPALNAGPSQPGTQGARRSTRPSSSAGQKQHQQHQQEKLYRIQVQEQEGGEEEEERGRGEGGVNPIAATAADPVEPSKAVLEVRAVVEAALVATARAAADTEEVLSRMCARVRGNQVRYCH